MNVEKLRKRIEKIKFGQEDIKALRISIIKWKWILKGRIPDKGSRNCALCKLREKREYLYGPYFDDEETYCTHGCVVGELVGGCESLGYAEWEETISELSLSNKNDLFLVRADFRCQYDFGKATECAEIMLENLQIIYDLLIEREKEKENER